MASIEYSYMLFDETVKRCVEYLNLDGRIYKDDLLHLYIIRITFVFNYRYLIIHDLVDYVPNEIYKKTVLDNTVQHLKEIKFQFNAYFNDIWC